MRRRGVDIEEVALKARLVEGLGRTTSNDEVLLVGQPLLDRLGDVATAVVVGTRLVDLTFDEVVPAEDLLSPEFEAGEQVKVATVGQSQLVLAI